MIIDATGIQLDSFEDILKEYVDGFKLIYGEDINLDQDTPDGQKIGILTNTVFDLQTHIARVYNSFDPDYAEGHELDKILKLIASTRLPASKSTVDVNITATSNVELPSDYTIEDEDGQEWVITSPITLAEGTTLITFESIKWGSVNASTNTITKPVTILTEIESVSNPTPAVIGRDEETDMQLRKRRNKLLALNGKSIIGSIKSKLLNLNNVVDVEVYENYESTQDTERDINPHTIWVIVDGGEIEDITEVIAKDKTAGCGLKGEIQTTYTEEFVRSNGTIRPHTHYVRFDRPTEAEIFVKLDVTRRNLSDLIDTEAIKNTLATNLYNIAQDATATELYCIVYDAGDTFIASNMLLSRDGTNWVDKIDAGYAERLIIIADNVEVTEV